ncbi:UDP-glucose dehydrogenase family protein [Jiangella endophytica]|uniref:UDP-glucose dehydrogenase family protein n=1 Tax=Jiangella endophytica TaxID=1623398 RepID=UPI000E343B25
MSMRISVIGNGYLGAVHAAGMAELGYTVVGIDVDEEKVAALARGEAPIYEPGLDDLLVKHLGNGRLTFTTDFAAAAGADVHFVCVGTPQRRDGLAADMRYVEAAIDSLAPHLDSECLVVGKSTVPVGTATALADRLAKTAPVGAGAELAWNPEFLREGFAVEDTLHPDRLVFGVTSGDAERTLREVYASTIADGTPVIVTDLPTAELVKVSANAFLATKISFINAMAEIAEVAGADVTKLADAIGHDARIGRKFLNAGIGFGGGCLPKDIRAFMARAGELGASQSLAFLAEIDAINLRRRQYVVDLTRDLVGGSVANRRIAVLGAAFKPQSDDVRDSPALNIAGQLHLQGARVSVYDPKAAANARKVFPTLPYAESALEACRDASVVLHLTEWPEFRELDPAELAGIVATPVVVDGRNCLDADAWRAAGWTYRGLGRP